MDSVNINDLKGVSFKKTTQGFAIEFSGSLYKNIGENINNGKFTKEFYHELKLFIQNIKKLE